MKLFKRSFGHLKKLSFYILHILVFENEYMTLFKFK